MGIYTNIQTSMASFDITPTNRVVPGVASWGCISANLPVSEQDSNHVIRLRNLESEFHVRVRLDSIDIHKNVWSNDLMKAAYETSYPLRDLMLTKTTVKINREWLGYWEIYSQTIIPGLVKRMEKRMQATRDRAQLRAKVNKTTEKSNVSLRGVPIRTFHIHDNHASSVQSMQKAINKAEFESGAQLTWEWLATYTPDATEADRIEHAKNKEKWTLGIDGEGDMNVANMRAWKNKIATSLKVVDVIIINNSNDADKPSGIAFALINLSASGSAIIRIPRIASTAMVSMIHLFAQCFESTKIIHTSADDRMYLYGEGFLNNLNSKHHKALYEFCELYQDSESMAPFTRDYLNSDQFLETLDKLLVINRAIQDWRYDYYEKLLGVYSKLYKSNARETFSGYITQVLDDTYKDESRKWVSATGFNFFAQE